MTEQERIWALASATDGASWYEAVLTASRRGFGGPPHGHPSRWDWGVTVRSLGTAIARHQHLERVWGNLSAEQRELIWREDSPEALELRRFVARRIVA